MRFGTYFFLQRPPGVSDADVLRTEIEQMVLSEALGYDSVWLTEHHFADYGISSAPSVLASAVLSRTSRVHVGLAVYVLPFHDPIRFAEETATLDILSGGRLIVGLGRGNRPAEFVGYRVPQAENRGRFEEAAEIVVAAWTQDVVRYEGRYWQIPPLTVHPKPLTRPHPPIAVSVVSPETITWTAEKGYRLLSSGLHTPLTRSLDQRALYRAGLQAAGHDPATIASLLGQWTLTKHVYVAPTDEEAWADARGPEEWFIEAYCRSMRVDHLEGLPPAIAAQAEQVRANMTALRWEDLLHDALLIGSPETVRAKVAELAAVGVGELVCWTSFGGLPDAKVRRSMQLFATEVIPAVRSTEGASAP
jgi:alkanesulfonate monooxygenase SsuD/methylene tetrahydromethanopterin reductase-like flavin-dependent oxidoreductase (luciferase family)